MVFGHIFIGLKAILKILIQLRQRQINIYQNYIKAKAGTSPLIEIRSYIKDIF
jgi:hypothetical protein